LTKWDIKSKWRFFYWEENSKTKWSYIRRWVKRKDKKWSSTIKRQIS